MPNSFNLKSSGLFVWLLVVLYTLLIGTLACTQLDLWGRICIILLIIFSFIHHLRLDALRLHARSWAAFTLNQDRVLITLRDGQELSGAVLPRTVIIPYCVVLCVKPDGHKLPVCGVIFRDAMDVEAFRQLRVRLRYP